MAQNPYLALVNDPTNIPENRLAGSALTAQIWNDTINRHMSRFNTLCSHIATEWSPLTLNWIKVQDTEPTEEECLVWIEPSGIGHTEIDLDNIEAFLEQAILTALPGVVEDKIGASVSLVIGPSVASLINDAVIVVIPDIIEDIKADDTFKAMLASAAETVYTTNTTALVSGYLDTVLNGLLKTYVDDVMEGYVMAQLPGVLGGDPLADPPTTGLLYDAVEVQLSALVTPLLPGLVNTAVDAAMLARVGKSGSAFMWNTYGETFAMDADNAARTLYENMATATSYKVRFCKYSATDDDFIEEYDMSPSDLVKRYVGTKHAPGYLGAVVAARIILENNGHAGNCILHLYREHFLAGDASVTKSIVAKSSAMADGVGSTALDLCTAVRFNEGDKFYLQIVQATGHPMACTGGIDRVFMSVILT